jgi:DNA polymerase III delta subunit
MSAAARRARAPDPGASCREWCARAEAGELPRLLLVLPPTAGEEDPWFAERVCAAARRGARARAGLELGDFDAGSPDFRAESVEEFLAAPSLFTPTRALVLERAGKALKRGPRLAAALTRFLAAPDGPQWAVVHADALPAAVARTLTELASALQGETLRFRALYADPPPWNPDPEASEAAQFLRDEARARGIEFERGAAGSLVQVAGGRAADLVQALGHFEMLGVKRVGAEDVQAVTAHSAEGSAFGFADAVLLGDSSDALRVLRRLDHQGLRTWDGRRLATREAFGMLTAAVARELGRTAAVRAALDGGAEAEAALDVAGKGGGMPARRKLERRIGRCSAARLSALRRALLEAERRVRRQGWREPLHALEVLALTCFVPAGASR